MKLAGSLTPYDLSMSSTTCMNDRIDRPVTLIELTSALEIHRDSSAYLTSPMNMSALAKTVQMTASE